MPVIFPKLHFSWCVVCWSQQTVSSDEKLHEPESDHPKGAISPLVDGVNSGGTFSSIDSGSQRLEARKSV